MTLYIARRIPAPLFLSLPSRSARQLTVLTAIFGGVVAAAGCSARAEASDERAAPATPVRIRTATAIERLATVDVSGTLEASMTADLAFQVAGRAEHVPVREGQTVSAGQLLAALTPTDYALGVVQANASARQAADEYARMKSLYERGSLALNDFMKFETAAQVSKAQADLAAKRLRDTRLVSPVRGVVARRSIDRGEMAAAGMPVFTIVTMDSLDVRVGIPEAQIGQVHRGAMATISVPAMSGRTFEARITMIGVSADPTSRTYPVKLSMPNLGHALLPGMIAEARIRGDRMTHAITVPGEAVVRDPEGATLVFVYLPGERRVYSRRVTVGLPIDREVEITQGLSAQDLVVVAGQQRIRDGALVSATLEAPASGVARTTTPANAGEGSH